MKLAVVVALSAFLGIGCAPFRKSTDAMLARHPAKTRTIPAARGAKVAPLSVGQWSLYRVASGKGMASLLEVRLSELQGFERLSVTDADGGQLRVRQWDQNKYQKVFTSAWFPGHARKLSVLVTAGTRTEQIEVPWPRQAWAGWGSCLAGFSGPSACYGCVAGSRGPVSTDRPEGLAIHLRSIGAAALARFGNDPNVPREDVTVPAGTFQGAIRVSFEPPLNLKFLTLKFAPTLWLHPAAPIDGVVKADVPSGSAHTILELVDFGDRTAK